MKDYTGLTDQIESSGLEVYWQGPVDKNQITILEKKLKVQLPDSFVEFLKKYGGGGVIEDEISGIENNDATLETGGTVTRDTFECRKEYGLPTYLVVIFYKYDELAWCLDTSKLNDENECPVVSYDIFSQKVTNKIADNFELFFKQYLELRAGIEAS